MNQSWCVYTRTERRRQAGSVYTRLCIFTALVFAFILAIPATSRATSVTAMWNPNPEPNIAGYQLMYGTASGLYTTVIDVGRVTSYSFSVTGGVTLYFVLQAYNTSGVYSPYSAEVAVLVPLPAGPSLSSVSPSSGTAGTMVTITGANLGSSPSGSSVSFNGVTATPTSWSATSIVAPVPAGAGTGNVVATIAGVPSNGLSFSVTAGGSGGGSAGSAGGGLSPFNGTPTPIPGQIDAANFDNGGEGVSYHDSDPNNAGGQYRQTGVDIEAASEGGFDVGWTTAGEWLNYTVNVASAGTYTVQLRVASPAGASLHLGFNAASNVWKTVSIPATGGWQTWQTVTVPVTLAAGVQQMTVLFDNGGMNLRYANVTSSGGGTVGLPSPWLSQDIGAVGQAGSSSYNGAAFTVKGAGADIWGSADAFQFTYQLLSGDGQIVARVTSLQNTSASAKAGIMFRESPTAGSANVMLDVEPGGNIEFMARGTAGGSTSWLAGASDAAPVWLKLVRSGSTITGSVSPDGNSWMQVGSTTISLSATVNVGLVVSSHSTGQLTTSTFDQVALTAGGGSGGGGLSPFSGTPVALPGTVNAANFDNGGEGVAYHDTSAGNSGGQYRSTDVDLEASSEGGFDVGWTTPGEWLNYTVNVTSAGSRTVRLRVASPGGATMHVGFNTTSNVWKTISIPATGGWQSWQTISVPVTLGPGVQQLTLLFDTGGVNVASIVVN
jgi:hypothetical protein